MVLKRSAVTPGVLIFGNQEQIYSPEGLTEAAMSTAYAPPTTLSSLRDYVSGSSSMQQSAESTVQLFVTHCHLKAQFPEIRLDKHVSNRLCSRRRIQKRKISCYPAGMLCRQTRPMPCILAKGAEASVHAEMLPAVCCARGAATRKKIQKGTDQETFKCSSFTFSCSIPFGLFWSPC